MKLTWQDLLCPIPCELCGDNLGATETEDGLCFRCLARAMKEAWGDEPSCACAPAVERVFP